MPSITRRNILRTGMVFAIPPGMLTLIAGCNQSGTDTSQETEKSLETESNDEANSDTQETDARRDEMEGKMVEQAKRRKEYEELQDRRRNLTFR